MCIVWHGHNYDQDPTPQNGKAFPILVRSRIGKAFSDLSVSVDSVWRYEYLRTIDRCVQKWAVVASSFWFFISPDSSPTRRTLANSSPCAGHNKLVEVQDVAVVGTLHWSEHSPPGPSFSVHVCLFFILLLPQNTRGAAAWPVHTVFTYGSDSQLVFRLSVLQGNCEGMP